MASAKLKVICEGDRIEAMSFRGLGPGAAMMVVVEEDGVKIYDATGVELDLSQMELASKCNPYDPPEEASEEV